MSIFGSIMNGIFGKAKTAAPEPEKTTTAPTAPASSGAAPGGSSSSAPSSAAVSSAAPSSGTSYGAAQPVDVAAVLTSLASQKKEKLDWRHSIVDLMKVLDLDSSLGARKQLAQELKYSGDTSDSATMNVWLHKQVMIKLAENGGKVPDDLKHA